MLFIYQIPVDKTSGAQSNDAGSEGGMLAEEGAGGVGEHTAAPFLPAGCGSTFCQQLSS